DVNDSGGLHGHPVKVIVVDDGSDPARYQAALHDLVENQHVVAFVSQFAPFTFASGVSYLESKRVPVIGGDCAGHIWNESPMIFPQCPGFENMLFGIIANAARNGYKGKKFGAFFCQEASACGEGEKAWFGQGQIEEAGLVRGKAQHVSLGEPDFTQECLQAQQDGEEILSIVLDVNGVGRALDSCARQGFFPLIVLGSGTMDANLAKKPGMNKPAAFIQLNDFPWDNSNNPGVVEYNNALHRYLPGTESSPTLTQGWAA